MYPYLWIVQKWLERLFSNFRIGKTSEREKGGCINNNDNEDEGSFFNVLYINTWNANICNIWVFFTDIFYIYLYLFKFEIFLNKKKYIRDMVNLILDNSSANGEMDQSLRK